MRGGRGNPISKTNFRQNPTKSYQKIVMTTVNFSIMVIRSPTTPPLDVGGMNRGLLPTIEATYTAIDESHTPSRK